MSLRRACITMRVTNATGYDEPRDSLSHDWLASMAAWEIMPYPVPNMGADAVAYVSALGPELLVFSGGEDLGESPERDATEFALLDYAIGVSLPVLAVCRGFQLLNSYFGGETLPINGHVGADHKIRLESPWREFYGNTTTVNSYHNLAVPMHGLASCLRATALDPRNNVEAAQHNDLPLAAVMWHPERKGAPKDDGKLVNALLEGGML